MVECPGTSSGWELWRRMISCGNTHVPAWRLFHPQDIYLSGGCHANLKGQCRVATQLYFLACLVGQVSRRVKKPPVGGICC